MPREQQISFVAGYSRAMLRQIVQQSTSTVGRQLPIWHTEFNYGILSGSTQTFLPDLEFGALHGIFHMARILAAINSNGFEPHLPPPTTQLVRLPAICTQPVHVRVTILLY
jgi:hypothetical protein